MSSVSTEDSVILSYHETLLHKSDVDLIAGPFWLNDTVISFYFEFLEKEFFPNEKELLFIPPEVTQCLKMVSVEEAGIFLGPLQASSKRFIFFALNDNESPDRAGGSHWSLLVYSRPENHFFHLDSLPSSNNIQHAWTLATRILPYLTGKLDGTCDFSKLETLPQSNGYDCGIHVLCNVDLVAGQVLRYDRIAGCGMINSASVNSKRSELLDIIEGLANK